MNRRDFLSTLGASTIAGISGCITASRRGDNDTTTTDESLQRVISLEDVDRIPDRYQLRASVDLTNHVVTNTQTAEIQISVTNTGENRLISIGDNRCDLFDRDAAGSDNPPGLWLFRSDRSRSIERDGQRWVQDLPQDRARGFNGYGCTPESFSSGETVTHEYEVWDDYRVRGYLSPNTYRWQENIRIWPNTTVDDRGKPTHTLDWGFSILVE